MSDVPDVPLLISLEENLSLHEMGVEIFVPFVIERLRSGSDTTFAKLFVLVTSEAGM